MYIGISKRLKPRWISRLTEGHQEKWNCCEQLNSKVKTKLRN